MITNKQANLRISCEIRKVFNSVLLLFAKKNDQIMKNKKKNVKQAKQNKIKSKGWQHLGEREKAN